MEIDQHARDIDHRDADADVVLLREREARIDHLARRIGAHLLALDVDGLGDHLS